MTSNPIIICATSRLARGMQLRAEKEAIIAGKQQWPMVEAYTLEQWLSQVVAQTMLLGDIVSDTLPTHLLSNVSEAFLWEQAITQCLAKHEAAELFDVRAMAKTAIEANQLMFDWQMTEELINSYFMSQETRQFLRWRHTFQALCKQKNAIEIARLTALQIDLLVSNTFDLPSQMVLAGFDRITPLQQRLFEALNAKGCAVTFDNVNVLIPETQRKIKHYALTDSHAECRAAVAWARDKLAENPDVQLAILSPVLGNTRRELIDLLDDTFHPETLLPQYAEMPRCYDSSIGLLLTEYPIVHSALQLLRLASNKSPLNFADVSSILQDAYWGATHELPAKAQLDAVLRQRLNAHYSLEALIKTALTLQTEGVILTETTLHLQKIAQFQQQFIGHAYQLPSVWTVNFTQLLEALSWANTRSLTSHEHQTQQAFFKALQALSSLDVMLGKVAAHEALSKLVELCQATMFQPEAIGNVHIQLLGLLETPALALDAVWVMNMNDQHWPPAVKLNPLLPAELQRNIGIPNASADVQSTFANIVQNRINHCAPDITFSYALKEEDRELRASPLLIKQHAQELTSTLKTLAETLAVPASMQMLDDDIAPIVLSDEKLRGGTKLFATQAICPAWAFYQYRLGAKKIETPVDGMDSMDRGSLLHKVLQFFWQECLSSSDLKAMSEVQKLTAIDKAITKSIEALKLEANVYIPAQILQIEHARLSEIMQHWLNVELERSDFAVRDCEKNYSLDIAGIQVKLTVDRVDELVDGGIVVIDYKSSALVNSSSWADERIAEPQLPIYAALALQADQVVAVCFAQIRTDVTKFAGVAELPDILPDVKSIDKQKAFKHFENWQALMQHWHASLHHIAEEIKGGVASVTYEKDSDLEYCEVKPLLRLPERLLQFENLQSGSHLQADKTN